MTEETSTAKPEQAKPVKPAKLVNGEGRTVTSLSIAGEQFDADDKGVFTIPAEHALLAIEIAGLVPAAK